MVFWRWGTTSRFSRASPGASNLHKGRPASRRNSARRPSRSVGMVAGDLLDADGDPRAVGQAEPLAELVEHHRPAERGGQGRDQEAMIPAGRDAADRPRGVAAQAVGHKPLARGQPRRFGVGGGLGHQTGGFRHGSSRPRTWRPGLRRRGPGSPGRRDEAGAGHGASACLNDAGRGRSGRASSGRRSPDRREGDRRLRLGRRQKSPFREGFSVRTSPNPRYDP